MIRNYKEGGLNALDFTTINQTFKINWIKNCLSNYNTLPWFWIPNLIFKCCGDLTFLLSCNFKCSKLPIKLSHFHKQAPESWKIVFKHNFSPHTCIIWNNENILSGNKSLFFLWMGESKYTFCFWFIQCSGRPSFFSWFCVFKRCNNLTKRL